MSRPIKFKFPIELERGDKTVEYEVRASVLPGRPGYTSGPPEKCYPAEPPEVESKEVWYIDTRVRCPEFTRAPRVHFIFGMKVTPDGRACVRCGGSGYIKEAYRRPELDDIVTDEEVLEQVPEPDNEPPDED